MSTEPENKTPLARLADAYEPTDEEIERQLSKIQASLAKPSSAVSAWPSARLLVGLSCASLAIAGAVGFTLVQGRTSAARNANDSTTPSLVRERVDAAPENIRSVETPSVASTDVEALPSVVPSETNTAPPTTTAAITTSATTPTKVAPAPTAPSASPAASSDTLEREARLLAEAVRASEHGDGERALRVLEQHARTFPNGWLVNERAAERIIVLCSLGRQELAKREARAFLDGRPKGPLAHRVETSCASQE